MTKEKSIIRGLHLNLLYISSAMFLILALSTFMGQNLGILGLVVSLTFLSVLRAVEVKWGVEVHDIVYMLLLALVALSVYKTGSEVGRYLVGACVVLLVVYRLRHLWRSKATAS